MLPVEIKPGIYWIGVNDRTTDLFEGLWPITQEGVSYNAYLINDEKKAVVDLSKALKTDDFFDLPKWSGRAFGQEARTGPASPQRPVPDPAPLSSTFPADVWDREGRSP